jgi:purine nucleosidase
MTTKTIILDTDIGTDVDDCLALALCLASSELKLAAVTTVYGDARLRARMVLKLLALRGVDDVPVAAGAEKPLLNRVPVYWEGHEGQGVLTPEDSALTPVDEHASDLIARTVMAQPGEVILIAIGPLTNVALAILKEPRLARALGGLVIMGGVLGGTNALHLPWTEHNFRSDPEAAQIVLASGAPMAIVPLDATTQVRIRTVGVARLAAADTPFHVAVADQVRRYPRYREQGWTYLHDPLAVATVIRPELVRWESLHAVVETGGMHTTGKLLVKPPAGDAPATAEVALGVSAAQAEAFIVGRIAQPPGAAEHPLTSPAP